MFFDRYEIHIQAFANVFYRGFIIPDPHLHKTIFKICTQTFTKQTEQRNKTTWHLGHTFFENFQNENEPHIYKDNMFPGCSHIFLYVLKHFGNN